MSLHWYTYADAKQAAEHCGKCILQLLEERLSGESTASIAISGGNTPRLMFEYLARETFDWSSVHIFWVDERAVPPTDIQSNYRLALETLIKPARIPSRNVHRIQAELGPDEAAARYEQELRDFFALKPGEMPHFDIIHRGIGPDAHTASLFPGEPLIEDREHLVAAVYVEKLEQWRITLLPGVLLNARHTVMLVSGADKAEAVQHIFEGPYEPLKYPAQAIAHHGRNVTWFFDAAAARFVAAV
jgi:6-phosphogluconolactonase